jgi:fructose-bisphosphate aldolase, class II
VIVTTRELYSHAYGRYALGAYNVNNLEQVRAVFMGHDAASAPFIVQISKGARKYAGPGVLERIVHEYARLFPRLPVAIHLDHGDESTCIDAIRSGLYTSVMIDASHSPLQENIEITRWVVAAARDAGISVEAELGMLGGVEEDIAVDKAHACLTDPEEARRFVGETGVDALAVAVGTSHGAYKFQGAQGLRLERIAAIQAALPGVPLVLHGASAVPGEEVKRINAAGGSIAEGAKGVDLSALPAAVGYGVAKINIDTDGRLVWTRVHREFFRDQPDGFDLRTPGKIFVDECAQLVAARAAYLGSAGQA